MQRLEGFALPCPKESPRIQDCSPLTRTIEHRILAEILGVDVTLFTVMDFYHHVAHPDEYTLTSEERDLIPKK